MGFDSKPQTTQVNPNSPAVTDASNTVNQFLQQLFGAGQGGGGGSNPQAPGLTPAMQNIAQMFGGGGGFGAGPGLGPLQSPFTGMASPLQQQAVGNIGGMLNQQSPEVTAFNQLNTGLMGMFGGQGGPQNPFTDMGAFNQGQQVVNAALPIFQQNLRGAQGALASGAPGRFSTAFEAQGNDLSRNALNDFNLFQQNTLMQGLGLQNQQQQAALNFMLGAGGLQQQGQLGAGSLLGQLAGQAGMNPFQRALGAGQFGAGLTDQQINPLLQLLLGGMNFAKPAPNDTVVSQGGGGLGGFLGGAAGSFLGPVGAAAGGALGGKLFG